MAMREETNREYETTKEQNNLQLIVFVTRDHLEKWF